MQTRAVSQLATPACVLMWYFRRGAYFREGKRAEVGEDQGVRAGVLRRLEEGGEVLTSSLRMTVLHVTYTFTQRSWQYAAAF